MRKSVATTTYLFTALVMASPAVAQEGISVFEGGDDDDGPITIGGEASGGGDDLEGESLAIEGTGSSASPSTNWSAQATLRFVEQGGVMFVPAKVAGKKVYFIFDTGAGLTTLTPAFAKRIGAAPGKDSPRITTLTANGPRAARLSVAKSMSLANVKLGAFTFSTCEPCGSRPIKGAPVVGLLGRNVISRIDFKVDDEAGVITLRAKPNAKNQRRDIERWLAVDFQRGKSPDKGVMVLGNKAPRKVRNVTFELVCQTSGKGDYTQEITFSSVGPRQVAKKTFKSMKFGLNKKKERGCVKPSLTLKSASW